MNRAWRERPGRGWGGVVVRDRWSERVLPRVGHGQPPSVPSRAASLSAKWRVHSVAVSPRDVQRDGGTGPLARRQRRAVLLKGVLFGETAPEVGPLGPLPRAPSGSPACSLPAARAQWQGRGTCHPPLCPVPRLPSQSPLSEPIAPRSLEENPKGQIMPAKAGSTLSGPQDTPPTPRRPSRPVLSQPLSLGEKEEIQFQKLFMGNRFCAWCWLRSESSASGSLRLGRGWR